jgi:CRP-like cAMP-binding protein
VKSARRQFDPQAFLAKVGTGKAVSKYRKGRIIYAQGEEADRVFYIQSGKVKVTVVSEQGKEAVVGILDAARWNREGDGGVPGHHNNAQSDAGRASQGTQVLGTFRDLPGDPEQSH